MSVLSLRRLALLLLVVVPVLSFECARPSRHGHAGWPPERRWKPQITVDDKTLTAKPGVSIVWDVEPVDPNADLPLQRSTRPVKITWKTNDPKFDLLVTFITDKCPIPQPECKPGQCTVSVPTNAGADPYRCTYKMTNRVNVAQKDDESDIVVMPCCM